MVVLLLHNLAASQDRVTVVASLVIDVLAEGILHSRQRTEFCDQVTARSPF